MSEPLRFNGIQHGRAHLRLVAAVGMLASAAIATGALVSLFAGSPDAPNSKSKAEPGLLNPAAVAADTPLELELHIRETELAAARARAALRRAREAGRDERELESYEHRLEQLGLGPLESLRRSLDASSEDRERPLDQRPLDQRPLDQRDRRSHLRAIASPSREL